MAGKRARQLAEQMVRTHLQRTGISKAAGGVQAEALFGMYLPLAEGIAGLEKVARQLGKRARQQDEAAEMIARQIRMLEAINSAESSPALRGFTDLDPSRFGVGLVDLQQAPPKVNGHRHPEQADAGPPLWHPETDN